MVSTPEGEVPEWFQNVPQDPNFLFSAKTETSKDLQTAVDNATLNARTEIARQTEVKIEGLQKRFNEEVGLAEDSQLLRQFTDASKSVVSTSLSGSRVKQQRQFQNGSVWRAYVLVEYPIGAANEALVQAIKKNEQMYTRFRSAQTFQELENEVKKYEDWKKQQGQPQ